LENAPKKNVGEKARELIRNLGHRLLGADIFAAKSALRIPMRIGEVVDIFNASVFATTPLST